MVLVTTYADGRLVKQRGSFQQLSPYRWAYWQGLWDPKTAQGARIEVRLDAPEREEPESEEEQESDSGSEAAWFTEEEALEPPRKRPRLTSPLPCAGKWRICYQCRRRCGLVAAVL